MGLNQRRPTGSRVHTLRNDIKKWEVEMICASKGHKLEVTKDENGFRTYSCNGIVLGVYGKGERPEWTWMAMHLANEHGYDF